MHNFFPFFGLCTPFLKYCRRAKFRCHPLPEIWQKNGVCYLEQRTLQRLSAGLVSGVTLAVQQLLLIRSRQRGAACTYVGCRLVSLQPVTGIIGYHLSVSIGQ